MAINLSSHFAISILGLILFFTTSSYSIRCWDCDSNTDPKCADPFDNTTVRVKICEHTTHNSDVKLTVCRKIRYRDNNENIHINRDCSQEGVGENDPCSVTQLSSYGKIEHCSYCSSDVCNSAPALFQVTSAVLGPVIVFLIKRNSGIFILNVGND